MRSLCNAPGFIGGPAAEGTAIASRVSRLFVLGARLIPRWLVIVLRRAEAWVSATPRRTAVDDGRSRLGPVSSPRTSRKHTRIDVW